MMGHVFSGKNHSHHPHQAGDHSIDQPETVQGKRKSKTAEFRHITGRQCTASFSRIYKQQNQSSRKFTDADKINFITLSVYSDSACEEPVVKNIEADKKEAGEITMTVPSDKVGAGLYYVITIDCAPAAGNGIVQISKISYIAAE